jgi:Icc protein
VPPSTAPILIAQITDTHVVDPDGDDELWVDNNGRLAEALDSVAAERPPVDALLATGDLTNDGGSAEYDTLVSMLAGVSVPLLVLAGNHDDRAAIRERFEHLPWVDAEHASWVTTIAHVRVVGLDSSMPGREGAVFDDDRGAWLRSVLSEEVDGPTILATHHPPFETGIAWMDRAGFEGVERLAAVLTDHPVERVVCGHLHRPITASISGIPVQVAPPTVQSVLLDLAPSSSPAIIRDPAGYLVHRVDGGEIVSHTRFIATGESPIRR